MEELSASSSEVAATTEEFTRLSKEVAKATHQMDEIVSFIKNIAGQTNLLGLNATTQSLQQIQSAIDSLSNKLMVIDKNIGEQSIAVDEMAKFSQNLAVLATNLS
ncbi:MAG: yfmS 8 [Firmicutes bacterium]|nr:yfmS 8 [Bacillota bacterium]